MKKMMFLTFFLGLALLLLSSEDVIGGRGRGGGGGGRGGGGGARPSPGGGGRPIGGGAVNPYGGGSAGRASTPIVGPGGGSGQAGKGGGSYTTKGGATINAKGAAAGGTTGGGVQGGKYVGGIQVTGPGGKEVSKVGAGGAVQGPGGNAIGAKGGATVGSGPQGSIGTKYKGGVAIGPQGGVAGKSQVGAATGPGGTVVGGSRGAVASGPYGAAAGRSAYVAGRSGTYYRSAAAVRGQGVYVRQGVANYPCFRPGWYAQYPGAWFAAGWAANSVWRAATYAACSSYCGTTEEPVYYNYGDNVTYQDDGVYFNGDKVYSNEEYVQKANTIADDGREAKVTKEEEWLPLGVFAMVQGEETKSNYIFQLAVNKQGVIRGNYYDAVTDSTSLVYGSVDKKTQRAAWTVGDRKTPIYEAGVANLTKAETSMIVHYSKDRSEQYTLVRIEEPEAKNGEQKK
jgi:hypothetical protein